jgi:hypothetical protein
MKPRRRGPPGIRSGGGCLPNVERKEAEELKQRWKNKKPALKTGWRISPWVIFLAS